MPRFKLTDAGRILGAIARANGSRKAAAGLLGVYVGTLNDAVKRLDLCGRIEDLAKDRIVRALADSGGSRREAARLLGLHPSSLHASIRRFGLQDRIDSLGLWSEPERRRLEREVHGPARLRPILGYELVAWEGPSACPSGGLRADSVRRPLMFPKLSLPDPASVAPLPAFAEGAELELAVVDGSQAADPIGPEVDLHEPYVAHEVDPEPALREPAKLKRMPRTRSSRRVDVEAAVCLEIEREAFRLGVTPEEVALMAIRMSSARLRASAVVHL